MSDGKEKSGNLKVARGDTVPTDDASSQALSEVDRADPHPQHINARNCSARVRRAYRLLRYHSIVRFNPS